jgi:hypothetical protein
MARRKRDEDDVTPVATGRYGGPSVLKTECIYLDIEYAGNFGEGKPKDDNELIALALERAAKAARKSRHRIYGGRVFCERDGVVRVNLDLVSGDG